MRLFSVLILLLFSSSAYSLPNVDRYCKYRYTVGKQQAPVCSNAALTGTEILLLERHAYRTLKLYPKFVKRYNKEFRGPTEKVIIFVITYKEMNSPRLFPSAAKDLKKGRQALARYFPLSDKMYIRHVAFTRDNTDFVHEMAHYLNECVGLSGTKEDEKIAKAFEAYYRKYYGLE